MQKGCKFKYELYIRKAVRFMECGGNHSCAICISGGIILTCCMLVGASIPNVGSQGVVGMVDLKRFSSECFFLFFIFVSFRLLLMFGF